MKMTGEQHKKLTEALEEAFPNKASLKMMLRFSFNENLEGLVGEGSLKEIAFDIVQRFKANDQISELLQGARKENPNNLALKDVEEELCGNQKQFTIANNQIPKTEQNSIPQLLQLVLNLSDEHLQEVLVLAATAAFREGKDYISTSTFYAALKRLNPNPLPELFDRLPIGAVPDLIPSSVEGDIAALNTIRSLSSCMNNSFDALLKQATPEHKIASEDVFIDIAKYGTGKSVRRLRTHGISEKQVDAIVEQLGWKVMERM